MQSFKGNKANPSSQNTSNGKEQIKEREEPSRAIDWLRLRRGEGEKGGKGKRTGSESNRAGSRSPIGRVLRLGSG